MQCHPDVPSFPAADCILSPAPGPVPLENQASIVHKQ